MDSLTFPSIAIPVLLGIGYIIGFVSAKLMDKLTPPSSGSSTPAAPQIIVNVPAEFKPLDTLPPTAIEGARAALYWTVFQHIVDNIAAPVVTGDIETATEAAQDAVDKVFGPAP